MEMNKTTICWNCDKAFGGCSWSRRFSPVDGWKAIRHDLKVDRERYIESYVVTECPLYEGEKDVRGKFEETA